MFSKANLKPLEGRGRLCARRELVLIIDCVLFVDFVDSGYHQGTVTCYRLVDISVLWIIFSLGLFERCVLYLSVITSLPVESTSSSR